MIEADGGRDRMKQDAFYVRLSEDAEVISVPTQATSEMVEAELDRTNRLGALVRPLREGNLGIAFDYHLILEEMNFLLLDKRNRPFLILKESEFDGPVTSATGTTWPHSIKVHIENISHEQATHVSGYASIFLDSEIVRPLFRFDQFVVDPYAANLYTFFVTGETYACGTSPSHKINLHVDLEYRGGSSDRKYKVQMWATYDSSIGTFRETLTDLPGSADDGTPSNSDLETKWRNPIRT